MKLTTHFLLVSTLRKGESICLFLLYMRVWHGQGKLCLFYLYMQKIANLNYVIVGGLVIQNGIRNGLMCCALLLSG